MATEPKPVTLVCTNAFKHADRHYGIGEILEGVEYELATDLTGAGRTRLATDEDIAAAAATVEKKKG